MARNVPIRFPVASPDVSPVLEQFGADHAIVGTSDALKYVMHRVEQVAPTTATVLLLGETGTGKELVARAIHQRSPRRHRSFVVVDCGALPASLIESELFGRERGAFTGAHTRRSPAASSSAYGGTVFLDEIGELPHGAAAQAAARAAGGAGRATRQHAHHVRGRPDRGRDQSQTRRRRPSRAVPVGPLLPAERLPDHAPDPSRSAARICLHWSATSPSVWGGGWGNRSNE